MSALKSACGSYLPPTPNGHFRFRANLRSLDNLRQPACRVVIDNRHERTGRPINRTIRRVNGMFLSSTGTANALGRRFKSNLLTVCSGGLCSTLNRSTHDCSWQPRRSMATSIALFLFRSFYSFSFVSLCLPPSQRHKPSPRLDRILCFSLSKTTTAATPSI